MKVKSIFVAATFLACLASFPKPATSAQPGAFWYILVGCNETVQCPGRATFLLYCASVPAVAQEVAAALRGSGYPSAHAIPENAFQAQLDAGVIVLDGKIRICKA